MFFFVLSSLARCSISIGLLDRPLVAAFLIGFATNTLELALPLGAVLELFWLDVIRLGAIIPPSGTLSFLLLYPLSLIFTWQTPSTLAIPLLICLPLAYTIKWLELFHRKQANTYIANLETWVENPQQGTSPQAIIFKSLVRTIIHETLLYLGLFFLLYILFSSFNHTNTMPTIPNMNWTILYSMGLMGAMLALRTKRAYAILLCTAIAVFLWNV